MTTLTILRGLPGSGKTTRARELVADDPRCARVNRDDLRMMMFGAKVNLTPAQERAVTLAAVSYTHLDVYKRQDEASKVIGALNALALPVPEESLSWVEES